MQGQGFVVQHHLDIPSKLPKMQYRFAPGSKSHKRDVLIRYDSGTEFVQSHLLCLRKGIFDTIDDYVHPLVYVDFAKNNVYKAPNDKVVFGKDQLLELRYLSNDLRNKVNTLTDDIINYLVYTIACRIIAYATIVKERSD